MPCAKGTVLPLVPNMIQDTSAQDTIIAPRKHALARRVAAWGGALLVVIAGTGVLVNSTGGAARSVSAARLQIATVAHGTLVRDSAVNGRVVAAISPTLYASAAATVTLKVSAGDKIKRGDILAELDSPELASQLKREQSSFEQLQAEVARQHILARKQQLLARRDADQAQIERLAAQRVYERIEQAGIAGVVAKNDFDKARDALQSAEIRSKHAAHAAALELDDVDLELRTRQSQLERQRIALDDAKRRVEDLKLRAPVDGMVGMIMVADRGVVAANTPLMTVVDLSRLEVELEIPETYAADVGSGMRAEVMIGDARVSGTVTAISPEVVRNQVLARVRFEGRQPSGLRQSQRVSARLLIEEKPGVLLLPRGSFVEHEGGRFAYVIENNIAYRRPVQLGALSVSSVEIVSGLKSGDKVVIAGTDAFEQADSVYIKD
jgi:HlyD family secretion protein